MELPQPLADDGTQLSSNQPQPKVVQPPYDNSVKNNSDAQAIPPRVMVGQKGGPDGCLATSCEQGNNPIQCCNCSKSGHHTRRCLAKRAVDESQWSRYNRSTKG